MRNAIGDDDTIDNEIAGAAYVENFALRVFTSAYNEDRAAKATKYESCITKKTGGDRCNTNRVTAKKFLAAANFLQIMSIFEKHGTGIEVCIGVQHMSSEKR